VILKLTLDPRFAPLCNNGKIGISRCRLSFQLCINSQKASCILTFGFGLNCIRWRWTIIAILVSQAGWQRSLNWSKTEGKKLKLLPCLSDLWRTLEAFASKHLLGRGGRDEILHRKCNCLVYSLKLLAAICTIPRVFRTII